MSIFFPRVARDGFSQLSGYVAPRGSNTRVGAADVNNDTALRHSAVWACVRTRADLLSTFPVDVFRHERLGGKDVQIEVPKPQVLITPDGEHWDYVDWAWASQADLDKTGNVIGIITARNSRNLPDRIELVPAGACTVIWRRGQLMSQRKYKIDNKEYTPEQIWHERQFPVSGLPVGLSPIAAAAWTIGEYLSIQQFALDWFGGGGVPKARLTHKQKIVPPGESMAMKERFKATIANGDLFVHGADWEYNMIQAEQAGLEWIEAKRYSLADICRFFGCPADLIDAAVSGGGTITYANITERNLQFLIHHLGPAVIRREKNFSKLTDKPRFVKLNTDALLRMDPKAMAETIQMRIDARTLTNTEARALYNQPPLTAADIKEFEKLYPVKAPTAPVKVNPKDKVEPDTQLSGREIASIDRLFAKGAIDVNRYS